MGGSVACAREVDPIGSEFNAAADRRAVDEVLGSGVPVRVIPIEVTVQVPFDDDDIAPWRTGPPIARLCADLVERRRGGSAGRVLLHDPVTIVAAVAPDLFAWEEHALRCLPDGSLVAAPHGTARVSVAVAVDPARVRDRIVTAVSHAGGSRAGGRRTGCTVSAEPHQAGRWIERHSPRGIWRLHPARSPADETTRGDDDREPGRLRGPARHAARGG